MKTSNKVQLTLAANVLLSIVLLTLILLNLQTKYGNVESRNETTLVWISGNIPVEMGTHLALNFGFDISKCTNENIFQIHDINADMITADFSVIGDVSGCIPCDYYVLVPGGRYGFYPFAGDERMAIVHVKDGVNVYLRHYVIYRDNLFIGGIYICNNDGHMNHMSYARISYKSDGSGGVRVQIARWHPQWVEPAMTSYFQITTR